MKEQRHLGSDGALQADVGGHGSAVATLRDSLGLSTAAHHTAGYASLSAAGTSTDQYTPAHLHFRRARGTGDEHQAVGQRLAQFGRVERLVRELRTG